MRGRTVACVLTAMSITVLGAAPAVGQERVRADLPDALWDEAPPHAAAPEDDGGSRTVLLSVLAVGAAVVGGFLITGVRVGGPPAAPAPVPAPVPPVRTRARRFEGCSISLARSSATSEFRVVVGKGPERRIVGRSQRFPAPRSGPLADEGPARAAFDELIARLEAVGWIPVSESDVWHRVQLVRPRSEPARAIEQATVDADGDGFAAFARDDYGNRTRVAERAVGIDQSPEEAHAQLIAELEADGWEVAGGGDAWFATTLTRRGLALVP